jgi:hypothetical protein
MYSYPMSKVAEFLQAGGEHSENLVFVVRDGTGELHEQGVQIEDAERWAEGSRGPDPHPHQLKNLARIAPPWHAWSI